MTAKRHDLICVKISDEKESLLPDVGLVEMYDPEREKFFTVDTFYGDKLLRVKSAAFDANAAAAFKKAKVDCINLNTKESYIGPLIKFFKERQRRSVLG